MRNHRTDNNKIAAGDLGCYDGPPIGSCPTADKLRENAITGSRQLRVALNFAGLRP